ncbi:Xaa-Pro aminopeptidase [Neolewinella lacunae]|uniref:Xaa-Pro aminopeptidase n=1 Tax=Neolewinella lacunae TaxID=1517758 RepID=A0A923TAE9_9BACT|nr:aminopeptidase P family protein [Neolewinella lacunae]MBC6996461.1 aminopeptidase P N-terminal domain-containing protein [Neolewinella lacunae]MDN3633596.1 Xaa-Pro aminopeptidase [Neolewinella lacunae]
MFSAATYTERRRQLASALPSGLIFLPGNGEAPMNYTDNVYPFRQDSNFRYFAGHNLPDLALTIDAGTGASRLWGNDISLDHVVWMGEQPSVADLAADCGAERGGTLDELSALLKKHATEVHFLPPYRADRKLYLAEHLGAAAGASEALVRAVIAQRSVKSSAELDEMELAVTTSLRMHAAAEAHAAPGQLEAEVAGLIEGIAISAGGRLSYPAIVTRNGHVLHNHYHGNVLRPGDLLLIDAGAETPSGYAGDLTRTFAVGKPMTEQQREIYDLVHATRIASIAALRPGITYRAVHDAAGRQIAAGLKDLGLMQGDPAEAAAAGAHALFMPHGLGHMIGLDVHDIEDLGEDLVGYDENHRRSTQFGTRSLRLGKELREGYVLTVEPGIYFIPALIDRWRAEGTCAAFINFAALEAYRDFGGIRLEDNVAITEQGHRVLGA